MACTSSFGVKHFLAILQIAMQATSKIVLRCTGKMFVHCGVIYNQTWMFHISVICYKLMYWEVWSLRGLVIVCVRNRNSKVQEAGSPWRGTLYQQDLENASSSPCTITVKHSSHHYYLALHVSFSFLLWFIIIVRGHQGKYRVPQWTSAGLFWIYIYTIQIQVWLGPICSEPLPVEGYQIAESRLKNPV